MKPMSPSMLAWLRSFEAAERLGSMTRAAEELLVSQGAVSQQIRSLEKAVGFALLVRTRDGLELTPEGRKLAPAVREAFDLLRGAVNDLTCPGGMVPVTLSCSPSFAMRWLAPRLDDFRGFHPGIDIRVFGEFHALDRNRMSAEGLEAAIRYDPGIYGDLRAEPLLDEYLVAAASPEFLSARPDMSRAASFDGRLLIHDTRPWVGAAEDGEWSDYLAGAGLQVEHLPLGKRFNLSQLAIDAALASEGIAIGRLATMVEDLAGGRLLPVVPIAVRSKATYNFISAAERPTRITAVHRWLADAADQFRERRETVLDDLSISRVRSSGPG